MSLPFGFNRCAHRRARRMLAAHLCRAKAADAYLSVMRQPAARFAHVSSRSRLASLQASSWVARAEMHEAFAKGGK